MAFSRLPRYFARYSRNNFDVHLQKVCSQAMQYAPAITATNRLFHMDRSGTIGSLGLHDLKHQMSSNVFSRRTVTTTTTAAATATSSSSFQLSDDRKSCTVTWDDGLQSTFHSVWLRHNCHCGQCRHGNGQRLMDPAAIPHSIEIDSVHTSGDEMSITWRGEEGHEGRIPIKYLRDNNYNDEALSSFRESVKLDPAVTEILTVSYEDIKNSKEERFRWMKQINEAGVCIVKGVPTELGMVQKVGELIAPVWESIYGTVFDVISVPNPINVAYSSVHLDYHMDLVYFESPPGLQLLHCLRFDDTVSGGHSTFLDVYTHAEEFRANFPEHFHTLTTVPATFQKIHYDRDYPVHIVNQKPHIKLNHFGDIVAVYWAPTFEGPLSVSGEDVERYYAAYEEFAKGMINSPHQLQCKLQPGDLAVFNNIRILHGRTTFDAQEGERHLQGCYINIDFFKSQVQVMSNLFGDGSPPKRVGNQCWL